MNIFKRFFGHLRTVNKHRAVVRKLCFRCGLYWQGLTHDLSKYSPVEFWNGVKYYTGKKSPHYGERAAYGYSKAWLNHKGRNKHHGEYWQDIRPNGLTEPIPMPDKYFVEMMCDRVAASMIYNGADYTDSKPLEYYISHKDENQFHKQTRAALEYYLEMIASKGTDETFKKIKNDCTIRRISK
jgi:hypothetical protein